MKQLILPIFMLCSVVVFSQNEAARMVIAIANETDTLSIKHFDASDNLVFKKLYPVGYQEAGILAYLYNDSNKITKEIWLDQYGILFISEYEYEYDSSKNVKKSFEYYNEDLLDNFNSEKSLISYLQSSISKIHNVKDLKESTIFKEFMEKGGRLSEITYCRDTLPVKTIRFDWKGDTSNIIDYSYNDQNLLILENYPKKDGRFSFSKTVYTYDTLGRILSKGFYYSTRLDHITKYYYETPNIVKSTFEIQGKYLSTSIEEYKDGRIVKWMYYDMEENKKKPEIFLYEYDEENRLIKAFYSRYNKGRSMKIRYIYINNQK